MATMLPTSSGTPGGGLVNQGAIDRARQAAALHAAQVRAAAGKATLNDWALLHPGLTKASQVQASFNKMNSGLYTGTPYTAPAAHPAAPPPAAAPPTAAAPPPAAAPVANTNTTVTNPVNYAPTDSPAMQSLMGALPSLADTQKAVQGFYAPALKTIQIMQDAAVNARNLRNNDINAFQTFVTNQATQAQSTLASDQSSYVNMANNSAANIGGNLSDAQHIVDSNKALASQSGLAGGVQAAGATLGAAAVGAQGTASNAQANQAGAASGTQYALDLASQERIAAQNAQTDLETNRFLPQMETIQQAIPGAVSSLWATQVQRAIEASKIDMAGQIAGTRSLTSQAVANTRSKTATGVANIRSATSIYTTAAKNAIQSQDAWIRAYASQNVANIKVGGTSAKSFLASVAKGPGGAQSSWMTFKDQPPDTQASMITSLLIRAKQSGVTNFKTAMSSIYGNDPFYSSNAVYSTRQYQAGWAAAFKNAK